MCGADVSSSAAEFIGPGSSPRVRGRPLVRTQAEKQNQAHPRVCGADRYLCSPLVWRRGSSPRVRGRPSIRRRPIVQMGLIPACAGQTGHRLDVCGVVVGSSPRVRGRPTRRTTCRGRRRLIPACAGQTCRWVLALRFARAHPRVCGADNARIWANSSSRGSSPRVRGRPVTHRLG